ncbi:hypothetical protein SAMN02745687_00217 [Lachnospiraceae bacterium NK3A20]|nr:hypothetical protein SAMN02745687_00217 [Lachnospiraceae bacterium NK3A20]
MAYTRQGIEDLFGSILKDLDISAVMFDKARKEYEALGEWIDKKSDEYDVRIYPQGSFALGTVIKPISGKDDYDLDLVCELAEQYELSACELKKDVVRQWLVHYKRITGDIVEKRRCWHVEYEEIPNFHMDVIPSYDTNLSFIKITDHNEEQDTYQYIGSNPRGYTDWFYSRCQKRWDALFDQYSRDNHLRFDEAEVERLDRHKVITPLQKAIQLLKRHRDIMFKDHPDDKPISIIITTLAAQLYNNEDNIVDALASFLNGAERYIHEHKMHGDYHIDNPSYSGENFADKWNKHPERARIFFNWLTQAQEDFDLSTLMRSDTVEMGNRVKHIFGNETGKRVFAGIGATTTAGVISGAIKVSAATGGLSRIGTIPVQQNHHFHGKIS